MPEEEGGEGQEAPKGHGQAGWAGGGCHRAGGHDTWHGWPMLAAVVMVVGAAGGAADCGSGGEGPGCRHVQRAGDHAGGGGGERAAASGREPDDAVVLEGFSDRRSVMVAPN